MPRLNLYQCRGCGTKKRAMSPPFCHYGNPPHGEMEEPLGGFVKVRGGTPKFHNAKAKAEITQIEWKAEREYEAKETADNAKEIADNTEKWKREYVSSEQHIKNGNPDEPNTRQFAEAGVKPREKSTIDHGFKHAAGGDIE